MITNGFHRGLSSALLLRHVVVLSGLLASAPASRAADGDWQQWSEAMVSQRLDYSLEAAFRFESRWEEDISKFAYYELEPMVAWNYSPRWDFIVSYERDIRIEPEPEVMNMATTAAYLKIPVKDWFFSNRFRMQWVVPEDTARDWRAIYRNRSGVSTVWKLGAKELVPYLFDEWFFHLQDGQFVENRVGAGIGMPIAPHWMASLYFMRVDERAGAGWDWHPVVGIQIGAQF